MSAAVIVGIDERKTTVVERYRQVTPELLASIIETFRQVPDLSLSLDAATQLLNLDALTGHVALRTLVADGALVERGGVFMKPETCSL